MNDQLSVRRKKKRFFADKAVLVALAAIVAIPLVKELPALRRYLRMRSM